MPRAQRTVSTWWLQMQHRVSFARDVPQCWHTVHHQWTNHTSASQQLLTLWRTPPGQTSSCCFTIPKSYVCFYDYNCLSWIKIFLETIITCNHATKNRMELKTENINVKFSMYHYKTFLVLVTYQGVTIVNLFHFIYCLDNRKLQTNKQQIVNKKNVYFRDCSIRTLFFQKI